MTGPVGLRIIHSSSMPRSTWANGRGYTRPLTRDASGSWRLSVAEIGREAPFSALPGIDRILVVAEGEVLLRVDGRERRLVAGAVAEFRGESDVSALALTDMAQVVNLMMVRGTAEFDGDGAHRACEVSLPQVEDEILLLLSDAAALEGTFVEPGTAIVRASADTSGVRFDPPAASVQFAAPVLHYRLTRRSPAPTR